MPNAAKPAAAGGYLGFQHGLGSVAEQQIDVANDAGADQSLAVAAARRHRRYAVDELDLADRAKRFGAGGAVHRTCLDIDGCDDVVAGGDIVGYLLDHVAQAAAIPEVVVRIDDDARGLDDLFAVLAEPVFARIGVEPALGGGRGADDHGCCSPISVYSGVFDLRRMIRKSGYRFSEKIMRKQSDAVENNHRRRCGQRLAGNLQRARIPAIDLELSSDPIHELLQRRRKAVHRQNNGGAQSPCDLGYAVQRHGVGSVDRNHDDVEPADRGEMSIVELVMQMPEMANAETGHLEDEDRVAVLDHVNARVIAVEAADVGRDIADQYVADPLENLGGLVVVAPAVQHMRNAPIRKQRVMRRVRPVHGDDVGQPPRLVGAAI